MALSRRTFRLLTSFAGVAIVTFLGYRVIPVNATTEGFAYLLLVLIIASTWGFLEAALSSVLAALAFNFFFFPPVGTFTIEDPQNWVALSSFLAASLIASRLSAIAKARTLEAIERKQEVERQYSLSRAILLLEGSDPFPGQLTAKLAEIFELRAATLYECHTGELYRTGSIKIEHIEERLRQVAAQGASWADAQSCQVIVPVRLGSEVIASLALEGGQMSDSVLEGIVSLVATGLERARSQDLAQEAAHQNEQLRTAIIDAMAHEFKTPLTTIRGATTALLANPDGPLASVVRHN